MAKTASINLNSTKSKLILFALVFALMGGVYYVFKSSASTALVDGSSGIITSAEKGHFKIDLAGYGSTSGGSYLPLGTKTQILSKGSITEHESKIVFGNSVNDGSDLDLRFSQFVNFGKSAFEEPGRIVNVCVTLKDPRPYGVKSKIEVIMHPNYKSTYTPSTAAEGAKRETDWNIWRLESKKANKFHTVCRKNGRLIDVKALLLDTLTVTEGAAYIKDVTVQWQTVETS